MIGYLITILISYSLGYGTHWYITPTKICKNIEVSIPDKLLVEADFWICKEGIDPKTGIENTCMIPTPRYVLTPSDLKMFAKYIQEQRVWLQNLDEVIIKYNEDKFILR